MATLNAVTIAITQYYLVQYPCQGPATEDGPAKVQLAYMTLIGDITNQDPADTATRAGFDIYFYGDQSVISGTSISEPEAGVFRITMEMFYGQLASIQSALDAALQEVGRAACSISYGTNPSGFTYVVPPL
jgi:hypothetical protein